MIFNKEETNLNGYNEKETILEWCNHKDEENIKIHDCYGNEIKKENNHQNNEEHTNEIIGCELNKETIQNQENIKKEI